MKKANVIFALLIIGGLFCFLTASRANRTSAETVEDKVSQIYPGALQPKTSCRKIQAVIIDTDSNGTNIRSAPDKNSRVVKTINNAEVVVEITGSSNGWFEISKAEEYYDDEQGEMKSRIIFQGRGWIHSSLLGMDVWFSQKGTPLHAQPNEKSRVLKRLVSDSSEIKPIGCKDSWVNIRSEKVTGWIPPGTHCALTRTTCS
jgi:SH3-like domain-containing protein